jgi:hypothetical protein
MLDQQLAVFGRQLGHQVPSVPILTPVQQHTPRDMGGPVQSGSAGPCWKGCCPERVSFQPVENAVAHDDQQQTSGDCPSETWRPAQRSQRRLYFRRASGEAERRIQCDILSSSNRWSGYLAPIVAGVAKRSLGRRMGTRKGVSSRLGPTNSRRPATSLSICSFLSPPEPYPRLKIFFCCGNIRLRRPVMRSGQVTQIGP